jgi:hypothetical protein
MEPLPAVPQPTSDGPTRPTVDPAALLVAVLAVGVGPLTEDGPWSWINTVVCVVVLVVLGSYASLVTSPREMLISFRLRLPLLFVTCFILGIALAYPIQLAGGEAHCRQQVVSTIGITFDDCAAVEAEADTATKLGLLFGLLALVVAEVSIRARPRWVRRLTGERERVTPTTTTETSGGPQG